MGDGRFSASVQLDPRVVKESHPSLSVLEAEKGKLGFVYKWTCKVHGKWYIGSHIGDPNDPPRILTRVAKDMYVASGTGCLNAMRKYGLDQFTREILFVGLDCRTEETRILTELDAAADPMSYNYKKTHSPEVIQRSKLAQEASRAKWGHLPKARVYSPVLRNIYKEIKRNGKLCSPRGQKVLELENFGVTLPPYLRFTSFQSRKLSLGYIKHEFLWYLRGDRKDLSIGTHAKLWNSLVDSEGKLNSNYGYYVFKRDQGGIDWVVEELTRDMDSRRAVITILDTANQAVAGVKDLPCTYALAFRIRDNKLNMTVRMRSCDAVWGFSNDLPAFSFIHEMVLCYLQRVYPQLECGSYHHSADSFHVYERHFELLDKLVSRLERFSIVLCPKMSGAEEVDFLRKGDFSEVPENYQFTLWLLDTDNVEVMGKYHTKFFV